MNPQSNREAEAVFYNANPGTPYPHHFRQVQERLLRGPTGARIVVVAPPRYACSEWAAFIAGMRLAQGARNVFISTEAGMGLPLESSGTFSVPEVHGYLKGRHEAVTGRYIAKVRSFAAAAGAGGHEELFVGYHSSELCDLAVVNQPVYDTLERGNSGKVRTLVDWLNTMASKVSGDILVTEIGRAAVPGGDLVDRLAKRGWEVVIVPAMEGLQGTYGNGVSNEELLRIRAAVGESLWASQYMGHPAQPRSEDAGPAELRVGIEARFSGDPNTGAKSGPCPMAKHYHVNIPEHVSFRDALQVILPKLKEWAEAMSAKEPQEGISHEEVAFVVHIEPKGITASPTFIQSWRFFARLPTNASAQQVYAQLQETGAAYGLAPLALKVQQRMSEICK